MPGERSQLDRKLLEFAVGLSERAGKLAAERFFAADFAMAIKADGTEVTDADLAVEALIRGELAERFPADGIYGEEAGATAGSSGRRWIIDPIDGTRYFAYYAGRGCGSRVRTGGTDLPPVLRDAPDLAAARVELVNPAGWPADLLLTLHRHTRITGHLGGISGLLTGLVDAIVIAGPEMGYEDLAPLPLILEEAGGRATDLRGGPLLTGDRTALLSTGRHHDALLDLLAPTLPH